MAGYRIIRAALGYSVVLVVTPPEAKGGAAGAKYYEYHPGRPAPGWKSDSFNEVPWHEDARYLFSGQADGLGFGDIPDQTFPSLEAVLEFIREKQKA